MPPDASVWRKFRSGAKIRSTGRNSAPSGDSNFTHQASQTVKAARGHGPGRRADSLPERHGRAVRTKRTRTACGPQMRRPPIFAGQEGTDGRGYGWTYRTRSGGPGGVFRARSAKRRYPRYARDRLSAGAKGNTRTADTDSRAFRTRRSGMRDWPGRPTTAKSGRASGSNLMEIFEATDLDLRPIQPASLAELLTELTSTAVARVLWRCGSRFLAGCRSAFADSGAHLIHTEGHYQSHLLAGAGLFVSDCVRSRGHSVGGGWLGQSLDDRAAGRGSGFRAPDAIWGGPEAHRRAAGQPE